MITRVRRQLYRKIFAVALWITILSMVIGVGVFSFFKKEQARRAVVTVNGQLVTEYELMRRMRSIDRLEQPEQMTYMLSEQLISEKLLDEQARNLNIQLDDQYAAQQLVNPYYVVQELREFIPPQILLSGYELTHELILHILQRSGIKVAELEKFVELNLKRRTIIAGTQVAGYVPDFVLRHRFKRDYASRSFSVATFSLSDALQQVKQEQIKDGELARYYQEHKRTYQVPEKRSGSVWEFVPAQYGITVRDDAIKNYYEKHKNAFVDKPSQIKVRHILFNVGTPEDLPIVHARAQVVRNELVQQPQLFEKKAQDVSEDTKTAKRGGLTEFFSRDDKDLDPDFVAGAFSLKQDGDIAEVVKTKQGLEIIQRVERKPPVYKTLTAVHNEIKALLVYQEFKRIFARDAEQVRRNIKNQAVLDKFVQDKKARKTELSSVERGAKETGAELLFKVNQQGGMTFNITDDKAYIATLARIDRSHIPSLEQIKDRVIKDVYQDKAQAALRDTLKKAHAQARTQALTVVAQEFKGKVRTIVGLKGDDAARIKKIGDEGLPAVAMIQMEMPGSLIATVEKDAYLVRLDESKQADETQFKKMFTQLYQSAYREAGDHTTAGFIASLRRHAKIEAVRNMPEPVDSVDE